MTVQIIVGDCREKLAELPDESVHCVVVKSALPASRAVECHACAISGCVAGSKERPLRSRPLPAFGAQVPTSVGGSANSSIGHLQSPKVIQLAVASGSGTAEAYVSAEWRSLSLHAFGSGQIDSSECSDNVLQEGQANRRASLEVRKWQSKTIALQRKLVSRDSCRSAADTPNFLRHPLGRQGRPVVHRRVGR